MKNHLIVWVLLAQGLSLYCSGQGIKVYRGGAGSTDSSVREFTKVIALADGHTVHLGQADEGNDADFSLTKITPGGDIVWQTAFGTPALDVAVDLCATSDGGFACVGWTTGTGSASDFADGLIIKTNGTGVPEWGKQFGGADDDEIKGVTQLGSGDLLLTGTTFSFGSALRSGFAARITASGDPVWSRAYSQGTYTYLMRSFALPGNQSMLCGYSWVTSSPTSFDPFFVRINNDGTPVWGRRIKIPGSQVLYGFGQTSDGGIVYGGSSSSAPTQNIIGKINGSGGHQFAHLFGTPNPDRIWELAVMPDDQILIAGFSGKTPSDQSKRNAFIARLSPTGQVEESYAAGTTDTSTTVFTGLALSGEFATTTGLTYGWENTRGAGISARMVAGDLSQNCQTVALPMTISQTITAGDSLGVVSLTGGNLADAGLADRVNNLEIQNICSFTEVRIRMRAPGLLVRLTGNNRQLELQNSRSEPVEYRLISPLGRELERGRLNAGESHNRSLHGFPAGIYRFAHTAGHHFESTAFVLH